MILKNGLRLILSAGFALCLGGTVSAKPLVVTTIAQIGEPLSVFLHDCAEVQILMGEGVDPHLYRPTRGDLAALAQADLVAYVDPALEAQFTRPLDQLARQKPVLRLSDVISDNQRLSDPGKAFDPHFWMDAMLWLEALTSVGKQIAAELYLDCDPKPFAAWIVETNQLYFEAVSLLEQIPKDKRVLVSAHDAFGYFGRAFKFEVEAIQGLSTESQASLREINALAQLLVDRAIPVVFIESSIDRKSIETLIGRVEALGGKVTLGGELFSDAMGAPGTEAGTYIGMLRSNVRTIAQGFDLSPNL